MTERLSVEQLAEIRRIYESFGNVEIIAVFRELDAVTRERDEMRDSLGVVISKNYDLTRERDEARKVTDEMVERAARVWYPNWTEWPEHHRTQSRAIIANALTAALGGAA